MAEGSTFIVEIPQKITNDKPLSEIPEEEVKKEETLEPFTVKDYKVLVVDDNQINRKVARSFLQSYELEITEAESGMEAIRLVRDTQFDIIFMDHMMPEMDGIETVQNIRNDYGEDRKLPIIIALTANAMDGVRENFLSNGFQDFITKPLDRKALHMVLLKWIPKENRMTGKSWLKHLQSDSDKFLEFQKILIEGIDTDEVVEHYSGSAEEYKELTHHGLNGVICFQETYNKANYKKYHPRGMKSKFEWRVDGFDRMGQAGVHKIGMGVLIGLEEWRTDVTMMAYHLRYLQKHYWKTKYSVNFPRMRPSENDGFQPNVIMNDRELAQLTFAMRIFDHDVDISYSTRESAEIRNHMATLGVTTMSAESKTEPGGYYSYPQTLEQFHVSDERKAVEVERDLKKLGREPVWKDWDQSFDFKR